MPAQYHVVKAADVILETQTRHLECYLDLQADGTLKEMAGITEYAGRVVNQPTAEFIIHRYERMATVVTQVQMSCLYHD